MLMKDVESSPRGSAEKRCGRDMMVKLEEEKEAQSRKQQEKTVARVKCRTAEKRTKYGEKKEGKAGVTREKGQGKEYVQ